MPNLLAPWCAALCACASLIQANWQKASFFFSPLTTTTIVFLDVIDQFQSLSQSRVFFAIIHGSFAIKTRNVRAQGPCVVLVEAKDEMMMRSARNRIILRWHTYLYGNSEIFRLLSRLFFFNILQHRARPKAERSNEFWLIFLWMGAFFGIIWHFFEN